MMMAQKMTQTTTRKITSRTMIKNSMLGLILMASLLAPLHAQPMDDEDAEKEWKEVALQLPEAPQATNLLPFYNSDNQAFSVDAKSLTITSDGIVRYTLVSISSSGAKNVSYEGIRCSTYEKKLYAFGRADGSWSRSRRNQWDSIQALAANKQHSTLFTDYFCEGNTIAGKAPAMLERLKKRQPLKPL
ncbi:CNP1-like family protein [Undibacterium sp. RTI2.2]|nr:CNP1-like family protein [Undibacterium sp. RTI2.2]